MLHSRGGSHVQASNGDAALPADGEVAVPDGCPGGGAHVGARTERWCVLLDAAKACCSAPPDLAAHPVDFVVRAGGFSPTSSIRL